MTANASRNNTLSDNERKQGGKGKLSSILGNNQISSYASSMVGGQNASLTTPLTNFDTLLNSLQQQGSGDVLENKTQKIRSQLNYFLKGRKTSQ